MAKIIRLRINELTKAQIERGIPSDASLAVVLGVSASQVWRAKLSQRDARHNAPGNHFIAGVLAAFDESFEKFFYLDDANEKLEAEGRLSEKF